MAPGGERVHLWFVLFFYCRGKKGEGGGGRTSEGVKCAHIYRINIYPESLWEADTCCIIFGCIKSPSCWSKTGWRFCVIFPPPRLYPSLVNSTKSLQNWSFILPLFNLFVQRLSETQLILNTSDSHFPLNFLYYSIILNEDFNFRKPRRCIENMHCHVPWVNSLPL